MCDYENCSEQELIRRAKKGDVKAFSQLYARIYKDLYRFALYMMRHSQDAEDAVSEAVISAFENMPGLKKTEAFHGWIFKILSNKCKKKLLAGKKDTQELSEELAAPELDFAKNHDVREAFAKLPEDDRQIVALSVFGGYQSDEIGKLLSMNSNTVRSKRSRALQKLKQMLMEEGV